MKLTHLVSESYRGDLEWAQSIADKAAAAPSEVWLLDRKTGKRLHGPFKDKEAATRFKANRPDRIPADAVVSAG